MNNLNVNNTRNGSIFLGVILAVLLLSVSGWGNCFYNSSGNAPYNSNSDPYCKGDPSWGGPFPLCSSTPACLGSVIQSSNAYYVDCWVNYSGRNMCINGSWGTAYAMYSDVRCRYKCSSQCEADSLVCLQNGGTWTNTGASTCGGKSCKMSNCLQSDTLWLNDSKAACDVIGGENNYAITDIDETCIHSGICCPPDSALVGNTCKWRCDSLYAACTAKNGYLYAGVLQDTTISGSDSTFTNKCYYNCSYAYNKDSTTSVTDGNTACSSPSTPIADCTRMPNDFSSVRTTYGDSVYSYDFLTPGSAAYIDSIVLTPCSRFMYRCTVNGKYKYWYSDADIPTGCTNIVKIK